MTRALAFVLALPLLAAEDSTLHKVSEETRAPDSHSTHLGASSADSGSWLFDCTTTSSQDDVDEELDGPEVKLRDAAAPVHLLPFPYADGQPGVCADGPAVRNVQAGLWLDGAIIEHDLSRIGVGIDAALATNVALLCRTSWFHEALPDDPEDLWLFEGQLGYRLVLPPQIVATLGVGAVVMHDSLGNEGGFLFGGSVAIFPRRPLSLVIDLRGGSLGSAGYGVAAAELDVHLGRWACGVGWELTRIGDVSLDGPRLALRTWW